MGHSLPGKTAAAVRRQRFGPPRRQTENGDSNPNPCYPIPNMIPAMIENGCSRNHFECLDSITPSHFFFLLRSGARFIPRIIYSNCTLVFICPRRDKIPEEKPIRNGSLLSKTSPRAWVTSVAPFPLRLLATPIASRKVLWSQGSVDLEGPSATHAIAGAV